MIKADVFIANKNWKKYIKVPNFYINKKLRKIANKLSVFKKNNFRFTLLLAGDYEVKKLNKKFRKKNKTTDILSFPFHEKKVLKAMLKKNNYQIYLGDIIINLNRMTLKIKDKDFTLNFDKIWIHGLAHLLGYRHKSNRDFSMMSKLENKLINISK
jgi:probable rRNA maturation factor